MVSIKVDIRGLSKSFETHTNESLNILTNINFTINQNELLAIIGPSGCGKTTLLKIIVGLEKPNEGNINYDEDFSVIPIIWQENRLFPWLTVRRNIKFGLEISHMNEYEIESTSDKFIEMIGLKRFENFYPNQLSEGMKQRVAVARALAINSELLLMDEPFASIDYLTKIKLLDEIRKIQKEEEASIVYVTHDIRDAVNYSDRILVLSKRPACIKEIIDLNSINLNNRNLENYILEIIEK